MESKFYVGGVLDAYEIPAKYERKEFDQTHVEGLIKDGTAICLFENHHNTICNLGMQTTAERLTGSGTYSTESFDYFSISDGTTDPLATHTAANFLADGSNWYTKAVTTLESYGTGSNMQQWTCYLTTAENGVASITKFAIMNADPATLMFSSIEFAAISKDSSKSIYFKYKLSFTEG